MVSEVFKNTFFCIFVVICCYWLLFYYFAAELNLEFGEMIAVLSFLQALIRD